MFFVAAAENERLLDFPCHDFSIVVQCIPALSETSNGQLPVSTSGRERLRQLAVQILPAETADAGSLVVAHDAAEHAVEAQFDLDIAEYTRP